MKSDKVTSKIYLMMKISIIFLIVGTLSVVAGCDDPDYLGFTPSGSFELKCPGVAERKKMEPKQVEKVKAWFENNQKGWRISHDTFAASKAVFGPGFRLILLKDGFVLGRGVRQHVKEATGEGDGLNLCT